MLLLKYGIRPWEEPRLPAEFAKWLDPVSSVYHEVARLQAAELQRQESR